MIPTQQDLNAEYGADTRLHDLPDREVDDSGSTLGQFLRSRGYIESARRAINQNYGWSVTIGEMERYY